MNVRMMMCLVAVFAGAVLLMGEQWTQYTTENGLAGNHVRSVLIDPEGVKWFGTDNGLSRFNGNSWTTYRHTDDTHSLADNRINDLAYENTSENFELWIATDNGVSVMGIETDAITFATPYRRDNRELLSNTVNTVAVDQASMRYFGTNAGLSVLNGSEWVNLTSASGLSDTDITAIGIDNETGWRYVGTRNGGVSRLRVQVDGITTASPYDSDWSGLYSDVISAIYIDASGHQWFGTHAGAAYHQSTETKRDWTNVFREDGLGCDTVQVVFEDSKGTIWFGTPTGVSVFENGNWTRIFATDGLISNYVLDMAEDLDGSMWFATDQGVSHMEGEFSALDAAFVGPQTYVLHQNYPNPFNPSTIIGFEISQPDWVSLNIYNINGQWVTCLVDGYQTTGYHEVVWAGKNNENERVDAGLYIVRMQNTGSAKEWTQSRKMLFIQ